MRWIVVVPAKALPQAKSRLLPASVTVAEHMALVRAIRADTLAAVRDSPAVSAVLVVADRADPDDDTVLVQRAPGLNAAVREAQEQAAARWPDHGVGALVGDLPALRSAELTAALAAAAAERRSFVADWSGTGTTLLAALPGVALQPAFGAGSAQRHARLAVALDAGPGLRHDVDTAADLAATEALGIGAHTREVLAAARASTPPRGMITP